MVVARVSEQGGGGCAISWEEVPELGDLSDAFSKAEEGADTDGLCQAWMPVCSIGLPIFLKLLLEVKKAQGQVPRADVGQPGLQPLFSHFLEMGS